MFGLDSSMDISVEPSPARVHRTVRPGWLLAAGLIDSHAYPTRFIQFQYLVFTMLPFVKSECIASVAFLISESMNIG